MVMPIWEIHMVLIYMVVQPNHLDNHKSHIYECNVLFFFISIIFFGSQWYMEEDQHRQEWGWCRWCLLALAMSCKTISLQHHRSSTHVEHISALCDSMLCYSVDRQQPGGMPPKPPLWWPKRWWHIQDIALHPPIAGLILFYHAVHVTWNSLVALYCLLPSGYTELMNEEL